MIILDNFGFKNYLKNSILGEVLALVLHLDVSGSGLDPDGHGCPETPSNDQYYYARKLLFLQLSQKINPLGSPWP